MYFAAMFVTLPRVHHSERLNVPHRRYQKQRRSARAAERLPCGSAAGGGCYHRPDRSLEDPRCLTADTSYRQSPK
jgi:hypothetical protein